MRHAKGLEFDPTSCERTFDFPPCPSLPSLVASMQKVITQRVSPPAQLHGVAAPRRWCVRCGTRAASEPSQGGAWPDLRPTGAQVDGKFDVSGVTVKPAWRTSPSFAAAKELAAARGPTHGPLRVLFLSEGNVCRSVLAQAFFNRELAQRGLSDRVLCNSAGTRDYNAGEPPELATLLVAEAMQLTLPADHVARVCEFAVDSQLFDLLLPVDKFTAADTLRETTVYDTIDPTGGFSSRVRTLAEFDRSSRATKEIDDPLYGSVERGGPEELLAVTAAAETIRECCAGLAAHVAALAEACDASGLPLRPALAASLLSMAPVDWLRPPMLSKPLSSTS